MSVVAEYSVAPERLVLGRTVGTLDGVRIEVERAFATDPDRPILFVWVTAEDPDGFEAAVAEDPTVAAIERLTEVEGRRLYRLTVGDGTDVVLYPEWVQLGGERLEATYRDGRWYARTRFPDREALSDYRSFLDSEGLEFRLERLIDASPDGADEFGLSEQQRETLLLAYERGFYDIPRGVTTNELADDLGVSNQAISERLRRGYARLIERTLL